MSILGKKWLIKNRTPGKSAYEKIIENRNLDPDKEEEVLHDPFLFRDMEKAVDRISKAITNKQRIVIFGDYDVDGISGTAILVKVLRKLKADVGYVLPNRTTDGYGLTEKFIDKFIEEKIHLVITVDCGISCSKEIKKAYDNRVDIIITDHHTIPEKFPEEAVAIIHPKVAESRYPFKELTGSGVAFKLAHALISRYFLENERKDYLDKLTDLASLGTVADLGILKGENRYIVKKGLEMLSKTHWRGLQQIIELAGIGGRDLETHDIGYKIAPRINAAGRIGDPYIALSLILQEEEEGLETLGKKLESLNIERQDMTNTAFKELLANFSEMENLPSILIAENANWHVGIIGLVAARLVEAYNKPVIVMQDFGDTLVASSRSPQYFNIVEAITDSGDLLISFGGHAQAAGFNLKKENLQKFKEKISKFAEKKMKGMDTKPTLEIDCEIPHEEVSFEFIKKLDHMKPFGIGNLKPIFMLSDIEPHFIEQVGRERDHLKFSVNLNNQNLQVIGFNMGKFAEDIRKHQKLDIVFHLEKNKWNEKDYLQLKAIDLGLK